MADADESGNEERMSVDEARMRGDEMLDAGGVGRCNPKTSARSE
jgi:hypothetical protein